MNPHPHPDYRFVGVGLYPMRWAARLLRLNVHRVRRWMQCRASDNQPYTPGATALWRRQLADDGSLMTFRDLMEMRVAARLYDCGLTLATLRTLIALARERYGEYPLQTQDFLTDGHELVAAALAESPRASICTLGRRAEFVKRVGTVMKKGLVFAQDGRPERWFPVPGKREIELDPKRCYGEPVIVGTRMATDTLYRSFRAENGRLDFVAGIWEVTPKNVLAAVAYEEGLRA